MQNYESVGFVKSQITLYYSSAVSGMVTSPSEKLSRLSFGQLACPAGIKSAMGIACRLCSWDLTTSTLYGICTQNLLRLNGKKHCGDGRQCVSNVEHLYVFKNNAQPGHTRERRVTNVRHIDAALQCLSRSATSQNTCMSLCRPLCGSSCVHTASVCFREILIRSDEKNNAPQCFDSCSQPAWCIYWQGSHNIYLRAARQQHITRRRLVPESVLYEDDP